VAHQPAAFGLLFVWLPFALGTRNRWGYLLLANIVGIITAHTFFRVVSFMHGPRHWYEMTPLLTLLAARGAQRLVQVTSLTIDADLKRCRGGRGLPTSFLTAPLAVGLVAALVAMSAQGWMMGQRAL